jgi:hypothetical protein
MSISPFSARPTTRGGEPRRRRLVLVIAMAGIAATLLAYAISPGVRTAVSHAAHSVKNSVSRVLDHDTPPKAAPKAPTQTVNPGGGKIPAKSPRGAPAPGGARSTSGAQTGVAP